VSIVVDLFAGGGGASLGIELALGRSPDVAINHDPDAVALHAVNHADTHHVCGDVWHADPRMVVGGRKVSLLWASPDCTFFSRSRGAAPFRDRRVATARRALAHVVVRWAREVRPAIICLENVTEFADWCPLTAAGRPDWGRAGRNFRHWVGCLKSAGYAVDWRELRACDYGAPTTRKRLFVVARRDGRPIVWPMPTHGTSMWEQPFRTAAECIDFGLPSRSIFGRSRPLAANTLARIARGIRRFVLDCPRPFVIPVSHAGDHRVHSVDEPLRTITASSRSPFALVAPTLIHSGNGEREGQSPRVYDIQQPLGTVMAQGQKHALVCAFLARHYSGHGNDGVPLDRSISTITAKDHHGFVTVHSDGDRRADVRELLGVDATVVVDGERFDVADIHHRMLQPRELFRAQGFHDGYSIDALVDGRPLTKTAQIRLCGNSVSPPVAAALIRANVGRQETIAA